ncbi:MAG TPA: chemotaxis-specific protein-glutamate methyltransferase CheB [Candidatus Saccharimonadales bacterium]|nr:chemotaxis-specific protein-glutamate methyltransferase CheB [Candidatus Saccharimonadales bacterium]
MLKTRVLVVEDSLTIRQHLVDVMGADPGLEVIGVAEDGKRAIELCQTLRPDVITLDMMLPVMTGLAVTEYVMAYCPTPILIVSASTNRGELFRTYDALNAGAVDVLEKPTGMSSDGVWEQKLVAVVKTVARVKVITHLRGKMGLAGRAVVGPAIVETSNGAAGSRIIAIGGSTGGPAAIAQILCGLPQGFPIPILLVLHIGRPFGAAFAEWLDAQSMLRVRYAKDGEPLPAHGQAGVVMAPPDFHLVVERGKLSLSSSPERNSCRPSVDVLFESLAREVGPGTTACLLTGMGKDGAAGLLTLRRAGALTYAQDERSSVIFGMPKEAIHIGAAKRVLALDQIAPELVAVALEMEVWRKP